MDTTAAVTTQQNLVKCHVPSLKPKLHDSMFKNNELVIKLTQKDSPQSNMEAEGLVLVTIRA
jgi:hypothetical protein